MKTTLNIEGMSCNHCVNHVTKAIKALAGVTSVNVSLEGKNAVVEHSSEVSPDALKAAVTSAGYEAV